jgi:hypothetical protein
MLTLSRMAKNARSERQPMHAYQLQRAGQHKARRWLLCGRLAVPCVTAASCQKDCATHMLSSTMAVPLLISRTQLSSES